MAQYTFDAANISKVKIDKVVPNGWNPKEKDTAEFQKVLQSIKSKGLLGYILVRNHPYQPGYYEILDGEQRWTAATQLKYKEVNVYNAGDVDDKEAKELTIWFQQQVPFSRVTEAYLVSSMVDEYGADALEIPYNDKEIADLSNLADFNFEQYDDQTPDGGLDGERNLDGTQNFSVKLDGSDYEIVVGALTQYMKEHSCGDIANALVMVCTELRIDQGGDEQEL